MAEFIKNSPFRFWCQKVLPLVYDDSLSYYELLCKVVHKLNELAENQNNLSEDVKQIAKDLEDFKNQVPGMIEQKVEEWLNNYIATKGLVNSVNGMKGDVTLTAADVGAIANTNGSVKNNNIAAGAVTADKIADGSVTGDKIAGKSITANKLADGVIPEKLPNPHKLTFSGGATGEYDGSKDVNIDIPAGGGGAGSNAPLTFTGAVDATYDGTQAVTVDIPQGGGGGGAVDSVNGETGAVVLKPLTAGEGLTMSGEGGYNGSAEQSVSIAPGGVTKDKIGDGAVDAEKMANGSVTAEKMAAGVIPTKLPTPNALVEGDGLTITNGSFDGSKAAAVNFAAAVQIAATGTKINATIYAQENQFLALAPCYIKMTNKAALNEGETVTATVTKKMNWQNRQGIFPVYLANNKQYGVVKYNYNANTYVHTITFLFSGTTGSGVTFTASGILGIGN